MQEAGLRLAICLHDNFWTTKQWTAFPLWNLWSEYTGKVRPEEENIRRDEGFLFFSFLEKKNRKIPPFTQLWNLRLMMLMIAFQIWPHCMLETAPGGRGCSMGHWGVPDPASAWFAPKSHVCCCYWESVCSPADQEPPWEPGLRTLHESCLQSVPSLFSLSLMGYYCAQCLACSRSLINVYGLRDSVATLTLY